MNRVKGKLKKVFSVIGIILGVIYILNPTFGLFEIIPDNIPYIGNLDEASAVLLVLACLKELKKKGDSNYRENEAEEKNDSKLKVDDNE